MLGHGVNQILVPSGHIQLILDHGVVGIFIKKRHHHPPGLDFGQAGGVGQIGAKPGHTFFRHDIRHPRIGPDDRMFRFDLGEFPDHLSPDQRAVLVAPDRDRHVRQGGCDPPDQIGPAQLRRVQTVQQCAKTVMRGRGQQCWKKGCRIAQRDEHLDRILRKDIAQGAQSLFGLAIDCAALERDLGHRKQVLVRQDQPIHMARVLVQYAVQQHIARVGRRPPVPQSIEHFRDQLAIFSGSGNRDPLGTQPFAIAQKRLEQPVAVSLVKACVKDNLHRFSFFSLPDCIIGAKAWMKTGFDIGAQIAIFRQIASCTAARHSVITPPEPL